MKIELPFNLGQEVYWKVKDRKPEEIMRMQFEDYRGGLYEEDITMTFKYTGLNPEIYKDYRCGLFLKKVKIEMFATLTEAESFINCAKLQVPKKSKGKYICPLCNEEYDEKIEAVKCCQDEFVCYDCETIYKTAEQAELCRCSNKVYNEYIRS